MTKNHPAYFKKVSEFLETPEGKAFFVDLNLLKPSYSQAKEVHIFAVENGARMGYESCLMRILSLSQPPRPQSEEVAATYGVPDRQNEDKK